MANFIVEEKNIGKRIDVFLSEVTDLTRSHVKKLCDEGYVKVNGVEVKGKKELKLSDQVEVFIPEVRSLDAVPENIPIDVIYQDEDIAVINKPQGMTVHAGNGTEGGTLVNALLYHLDSLSGINGVIRPGIVHRIDKNTSGLLVVAKNDKAHTDLAKQLEDKTCRRIYVALVEGNVKEDSGTISTDIGRNKNDRTKMAVVPFGRNAVTDFKVIKRYEGYTLMEFSLRTGRTHQIRVHCQHIGHPIVGDKEYGFKNQKFKLEGQLLHARKLIFIHPTKKVEMQFEAPVPNYFTDIIKKLKEKDN
ncbi:MAG: RluA family pseudouridine synthase [Clostridiales bacterium]|nr:RluA family pseudouridine synthase [Clostridiales bacterium]